MEGRGATSAKVSGSTSLRPTVGKVANRHVLLMGGGVCDAIVVCLVGLYHCSAQVSDVVHVQLQGVQLYLPQLYSCSRSPHVSLQPSITLHSHVVSCTVKLKAQG